jgi:pimeloyl-ACP methyl ester carboxylesterase
LRGSFASYRAIDASIAQNEQRKTRRLTLPVLAIGGGKGLGEGTANTMRLVADNVESKIIPESGHWVAEEAPEQRLAALAPFLAPYRNATSR